MPVKKKGSKAKYCHERLEEPKHFDRRSFRTITPRRGYRVVIGCPKGEWMPRAKRCKVGTVAQAILHPKSKCPKGRSTIPRRKSRGPRRFQGLGRMRMMRNVFLGGLIW